MILYIMCFYVLLAFFIYIKSIRRCSNLEGLRKRPLALNKSLSLIWSIFQLVDALKEQEEINFRLRQYMDKIILAILDHNPSILEIKH